MTPDADATARVPVAFAGNSFLDVFELEPAAGGTRLRAPGDDHAWATDRHRTGTWQRLLDQLGRDLRTPADPPT